MFETDVEQTMLRIMEVGEIIDGAVDAADKIAEIPFERLDRETWRTIQEIMPTFRQISEAMKASLIMTSKLIDNPALKAHIEAVVLAED